MPRTEWGEKLLAPPCQGILITLPQCQYSDDRARSCFYCQKSCLKVPLLSFVGFPVLLVLHDYFHTCEMSEKLEPSAVQVELFATVENGADEMPETPCLYSSFPPHLHYYVTHCHVAKVWHDLKGRAAVSATCRRSQLPQSLLPCQSRSC